jgi:S1-C subfamily serine protease
MFGLAKSLNECSDVSSLAIFLEEDPKSLLSYLYSDQIKYRIFYVKKKDGKNRTIAAPVKRLKALQKKVKTALEFYYAPKKCCHGFVKDRSIITNSQSHLRKEFVFNLDLENYFGSISFGRVKRLFESAPFNLNHPVASVLAHICCYELSLPQGAPTSPLIANMMLYKMDKNLLRLASKKACSYSRYADDLTFSFTNLKNNLPKDLVFFSDKDGRLEIGNELLKIISDNGFSINTKKTRIQHKTQRQSVTNITVNEKLNVSRVFIRATSAMLHALVKFGPVHAEREYFDKYHSGYISERHLRKVKQTPGLLFTQKVRGRLNFIRSVRGENCSVWRKLMYQYTLAIGAPDEKYAKSAWDVAAESTLILFNTAADEFAQGSSFLLDGIGLVTNQHVVDAVVNDSIADQLEIKWLPNQNKMFLEPKVLGVSLEDDLAIITSEFDFTSLPKLHSEVNPNYKVGSEVYCTGYPDYREGQTHTVLRAKITGELLWMEKKRISIDQPIIHGNSGGPVLNSDGKVIGIVANGNAQGAITKHKSMFIPIEALLKFHSSLT